MGGLLCLLGEVIKASKFLRFIFFDIVIFRTHPAYSLVFLLSGGGKLNYAGTKVIIARKRTNIHSPKKCDEKNRLHMIYGKLSLAASVDEVMETQT